MLRRIAVVGGNGFVGRHVLASALSRGIEAIGVVRSEEGARIVRGLGANALRAPSLDRASTTALIPDLSGVDGVVYTASVSTGIQGADRTDPSGLRNVLDACEAAGIKGIVLFSGLGIAHYGMNPHCTNPYFLAKMAGEVAAFRSKVATTVFRPSYIFGAGDEFLSPLMRRIAAAPRIEVPGDGGYRLQPISVEDAASAALGALFADDRSPRVVDLVGPDIVSYQELIHRVSRLMKTDVAVTHRPVSEAIAMAKASGYFGLRPHDLACLLCDEVSASAPVEVLTGGTLESLDAQIARVLNSVRAETSRVTPRMRSGIALTLIFIGALLVRGLYLADGIASLYTTEQDGTRMARRYDDSALAILSGDGILFPRVWDPARTGLASRPPGYPMFLASVYAFFGRSFPLVAVVQDVLTALGAVLAFLFVRGRFGFLSAVLAGCLMALSPHLAATSNLILADAIAPLPLLAAFLLVVPALQGGLSRGSEVARFAGMGVLIGVGIWLRPNVLLLGPFAAVFLFFLLGRTRRALALAGLVALVSLAVVAPITLRNWLVFREFVPVSINGGITLWQGVADAGGKEYGARVWDKQVIAEEAERYKRPDYLFWWAEPEGIARDRDRYKRATDVIKERPFWYAKAMVRRMGAMMLFLHGPKPLDDGSDGSAVPPPLNAEDRVPLQSVPGLDLSVDDAAFARVAGFASFLRAPLRLLHELWFVIPLLVWVGVGLAFRLDARATVLWLVVPAYYLIFESPFLYEWRVAVPMQYFLLSFAGVSLGSAVNFGRRRAGTPRSRQS